MRIAVDTNVFSAFLSGDPTSAPEARVALEGASERGQIAVSPAVYAELVAGRDASTVENFFSEKSIEVDWYLGQDVWRIAGTRYGDYARTRRKQRGDPGPRRILADFLIGAYALHLTGALLTSDTRIYGTYFSELTVLIPEELSP